MRDMRNGYKKKSFHNLLFIMAFFIAYISGVILFPIIDFFGIYYLVLPAFRRSPI